MNQYGIDHFMYIYSITFSVDRELAKWTPSEMDKKRVDFPASGAA